MTESPIPDMNLSEDSTKTTNMLGRLFSLKRALMATTSTNEKLDILRGYANDYDVCRLLEYTYNSQIKFGVSSAKAIEYGKKSLFAGDIYDVLTSLVERKVTGNNALALCNAYASALDAPLREVFWNIIDKDLEVGINEKSLYKVINRTLGDITFGVALANPIDKVKKDVFSMKGMTWFASRKLDGVRCITIKQGNDVHFYSRQCKEFTTLNKLKDVLLQIDGDFVLDGECCIYENGMEDFTAIVSQIKRKDFTIEHPMYMVFDMLTIDELFEREESPIFYHRIRRVKDFFKDNADLLANNFTVVEQTICESKEELVKLKEEAAEKGWEGVMLRADVSWEGKRTNNLLKVKAFSDTELKITGYELGDMRFKENSKEVTLTNILTNILVDYKGYQLSVGSGFSKQQRIDYAKNPMALVGNTVKVKYFQESKNKDGGLSLRFPTVLYIYDGERFD